MSIRFKSSNPGMSIIELLTSIAVIAIISAIFVSNYRSNLKRTDIIMTSQTLVSDIRRAQSNALGLVEYQGLSPAGGWGIYFNTSPGSDYIIFADTNANRRFDTGEDNEAYGAQHVYLPDTIKIDQISLGGTANVVFLPPDPTTLISQSGGTTFPAATVRLLETVSSTTKTIRVNFLGLAEVID